MDFRFYFKTSCKNNAKPKQKKIWKKNVDKALEFVKNIVEFNKPRLNGQQWNRQGCVLFCLTHLFKVVGLIKMTAHYTEGWDRERLHVCHLKYVNRNLTVSKLKESHKKVSTPNISYLNPKTTEKFHDQ